MGGNVLGSEDERANVSESKGTARCVGCFGGSRLGGVEEAWRSEVCAGGAERLLRCCGLAVR